MSNETLSSNRERQEMIKVRDINMLTVSVGEGTPLMLIPGGPGFGYYHLRPAIKYLASEFKVRSYDQRGCGQSETGDKDQIAFTGQLKDLEELRKKLGLKKLNLIGHSLGAHLALLYAAQYPESTASVVLANTGPPIGDEFSFGDEMVRRRTDEEKAEMAELEESAEFKAQEPKTLERYYQLRYSPFYRDHANIKKLPYDFTKTTADNVLDYPGLMMRDFKEHDVLGKLKKIKAPTLVVHSEVDPIPIGFSQLLADGIKGSEFLLAKGVNHFGLIEDPDLYWDKVVPFLNRHAV